MNWCGHNSDPLVEAETGGVLSSSPGTGFPGTGVESVPAPWWRGHLSRSPRPARSLPPPRLPSTARETGRPRQAPCLRGLVSSRFPAHTAHSLSTAAPTSRCPSALCPPWPSWFHRVHEPSVSGPPVQWALVWRPATARPESLWSAPGAILLYLLWIWAPAMGSGPVPPLPGL